MSAEPAAPASPVPPPAVDTLTPEQATAEVATTRANSAHDWHHQNRAGHKPAAERMLALMQRAGGGSAPAPGAPAPPKSDLQRKLEERYGIAPETPDAPPAEAFADPADGPRTAADLSAMPPPELSEDAKRAGFSWDETKLGPIYAKAEQEGLVPLVRKGLHLIAHITNPNEVIPEAAVTRAAKDAKWGRAAPAKWAAAYRGWAYFKTLDADAAERLDADGSSDHPAWIDYMVELGEGLVDATTPGGERRQKEKYAQWVASR